jgi:hypothetical protein
MPLRSRKHGVAVSKRHAARRIRTESLGIHGPDTRNQAISGRVADEIIEGAAASLRRDGECSVFDETAGVAELYNVFPRGALVRLAAPGDSIWAIFKGIASRILDREDTFYRPCRQIAFFFCSSLGRGITYRPFVRVSWRGASGVGKYLLRSVGFHTLSSYAFAAMLIC